jgi:uncharacterized coiled-coil protein SlyX
LEKACSTGTKFIDSKLTVQELSPFELKEARAMIANLKKKRRKDKRTIQELSEVIHEQNFLLQHNDQYMLDLENQLEAVAAPPPNPEEEEDPEEIQGESGVEPGPASP